MKTIATAVVFLILATSLWADELKSAQANDSANANEPIVLSEAEMDGVTAAGLPAGDYTLRIAGVLNGYKSTFTSYTFDSRGN